MQAARAELEEFLDDRRETLEDLSEVVTYVGDMRVFFEDRFAEQKAFIRSFAKEIVVEVGEAVVKYNLPLPSDSVLERKNGEMIGLPSPVLSIVHHGGR